MAGCRVGDPDNLVRFEIEASRGHFAGMLAGRCGNSVALLRTGLAYTLERMAGSKAHRDLTRNFGLAAVR